MGLKIVKEKAGSKRPHIWGQYIVPTDTTYTEEKNLRRAKQWLDATKSQGREIKEHYDSILADRGPPYTLTNDAIIIVWEEEENEFGPISP